MALGYIGVGTASQGTNGNPNPVAPGTVNAGDVLVAVIGWRGSTTTITENGGNFAEISGSPFRNTTSNINEIRIYTKIADGTEDGATIAFTKTGGGVNQTFNSVVFGFSGADQTTPINVIGTKSENTSATNIGPISGITPTTAGSWVVVVGHRADDWATSGSVATLTGDGLTWAEVAEPSTTSGSDGGTVIDYGTGWTTGAITNKTFVVTNGSSGAANTGLGVMFAIQPAAATFAPPLKPYYTNSTLLRM